MTTEQVIDADVIDDDTRPPASSALAVREQPALSVAPQVEAAELGQRLDVIKQAMEQQMRPAVDYGVIPGTNKPTLLKPGAEKLSVLFQLDVQLVNEKTWEDGGHLTVESRATVYHAPTGQRLGFGEGLCTTREAKYAYRNSGLTCPECGKETVRKSRKRDDGSGGEGWYCWRKPDKGSDGCGAKFPEGDERLANQQTGRVDNPDLPDTWNTVIKMAEKRARVDAILSVTGASALFTQDVEDQQVPDNERAPASEMPPFGPEASKDVEKQAKLALGALAHGDGQLAVAVWKRLLADFGGYLPAAAAVTLTYAASAADPTAVETPEVN